MTGRIQIILHIAMFFFRPQKSCTYLPASSYVIFKMLARFSKYDFWIPGQILDFKNIFSKKIVYFSKSKKSEILKKWGIFGILRIFNGFP